MGMPNKSKRMLLKSGLALGLSNLVSIQEILAKNDPFFMMDATAQADLIKKGDLLATDAKGEIRAASDGFMLMPLYQKEGNDGFFLVSEVKEIKEDLSLME